jgi:hypothetical protein
MPRFVLLHHECPPDYIKPSHWDFMLEFQGSLWTWELRELPPKWCGNEGESENVLSVTRLADHRIEYLDYEGPLTGSRGSVTRVASGSFAVLQNTSELLQIQLDSDLYRGVVQLTPTSQLGCWDLRLLD